jgi:hypothetical protein
VGAGLAKQLAIEQNGRLTFSGYLINALILATCLGTLAYPLLSHQGTIHFDCIFKEVTGLPCPSCGYSTALIYAFQKDLQHAFFHNPGWPIWIAFQLIMVFIGLKSLILGRQAIIGQRLMYLLILLIVLIWAGKFLIGPEYY